MFYYSIIYLSCWFFFISKAGKKKLKQPQNNIGDLVEEAQWLSLIGLNFTTLTVALKVQCVKFGLKIIIYFANRYINISFEKHCNDCILVFLPIKVCANRPPYVTGRLRGVKLKSPQVKEH